MGKDGKDFRKIKSIFYLPASPLIRCARARRLPEGKVVTLKSVSQAMNYACDELFDELPAKKVAIIGSAQAEACEFLQAGLRRQGCEVARFNDFAELDKARLNRLALIFVVVASLPARSLYAQVESLVRRAGSVCLIPVVEYADQEKAATLLELGCVDYLLSPFSETQLGALLRRQVCAETAQESFVSCSQADPDHWRDRHRQGADGALHPSLFRQPGRTLRRGELRGDPRADARIHSLRP